MRYLIIALLVLAIGAGYGYFINAAIEHDLWGLSIIIPLVILSEILCWYVAKSPK